jgi:hypothetical protein
MLLVGDANTEKQSASQSRAPRATFAASRRKPLGSGSYARQPENSGHAEKLRGVVKAQHSALRVDKRQHAPHGFAERLDALTNPASRLRKLAGASNPDTDSATGGSMESKAKNHRADARRSPA